jgi:hypothetical protein
MPARNSRSAAEREGLAALARWSDDSSLLRTEALRHPGSAPE